jgi:putative transposase
VIYRGYRYELRPTPAQAERLRSWVGATRLVFNLAFEQRRDFWRQYRRQTGHHLTWVVQSREVTDLRAEYDWLADVPRAALEQALKDLDGAFSAFFAGRARFPRPRRKGENDAFRLQGKDVSVKRLNAKWSAAKLPKLGWVKFRDTRPCRGRLLNVTFSLVAGRWYVGFAHEIEHEAQPSTLPSVGIDRGVTQTLTLSTGEVIQAPDTRAVDKRRRRAQKALARCKRGSARRAHQKARVAALSARAGRIRTDWCHRASTDIVRRFGTVAIEDLKIANMTASAKGTVERPGRNVRQKAGLNRSILEQCWGKFATFLEYKLAEHGGTMISVQAAYTSQTCAGCGVVDARSRKSQAVFACVHCDHTDNADVNAAREILRRSTPWLVGEGAHWAPVEPSIMASA